MTLAEAIYHGAQKLTGHGIPNARLDAEVLLSHILNKDRAWIFTHGSDVLDGASLKLFDDAISRRSRREPLQYLTGKQEFWGLDFMITPDVLIPRPETELIVESALTAVEDKKKMLGIIDLCTGSGCIAISLARELSAARIAATDKSSAALAVARENARRHGVADRVRFFEGDLFGPLEELDIRGQVDIIVSNPPYVPSGDFSTLQPEVRDYEPAMALFAGPEGTEVQRRIIDEAPDFLTRHGRLIMEMGLGQAAALACLIGQREDYGSLEILKDLAGIDRVIVAQKL